jgi:hypothetical protein
MTTSISVSHFIRLLYLHRNKINIHLSRGSQFKEEPAPEQSSRLPHYGMFK